MISRQVRLILAAACVGMGLSMLHADAHEANHGPNGGQVVEVKGHHVELTIKGQDLVVYLSDEGEKTIASAGASGKAVILEGAKQSTVQLLPAQPNRLTAKLDVPLATGARVVISAKLGDGHDLLARFVIK